MWQPIIVALLCFTGPLLASGNLPENKQSKQQAPATQLPAADSLQLIKALPIVDNQHLSDAKYNSQGAALQPSGLAFCNGHLLMISDRHDQQVFRLTVESSYAQIDTYRSLDIPSFPDHILTDSVQQLVSQRRFDWEGISCHGGNLYLLSEQYHSVLNISPVNTGWLDLPRHDYVGKQGILRKPNAGLEGISRDQNGDLLLAAERDARGLLKFTATPLAPEKWRLQRLETPLDPAHPSPADRSPDFSGLVFDDPWLFSLERNLFRICRRNDQFQESRCWSYADTELAETLRYDSVYGVAEGIAIDEQYIYLVTDNNDKPLLSQPNDRRARLWIFAKPDNWKSPIKPDHYSKP